MILDEDEICVFVEIADLDDEFTDEMKIEVDKIIDEYSHWETENSTFIDIGYYKLNGKSSHLEKKAKNLLDKLYPIFEGTCIHLNWHRQ